MIYKFDQKSAESFPTSKQTGTLAIDLGSTTTVVAFQAERDQSPQLLNLHPISRIKGEIPSLIWLNEAKSSKVLCGQEVINARLTNKDDPNLSRDFKRWIGSPKQQSNNSFLTPEKAGELLIHRIWNSLPPQIKINRLVLTAPVESYKAYRTWLNDVCASLPVNEIALVDEPTAAAMGANLPPGAKLLVMDIGGSTIDFSIVALEGGEGKAAPIAQLIRFNGEDLEKNSQQILRCAKVLGKAGLRVGGRDIDKWIVSHLFPNERMKESWLNAAEKLKCRLSELKIEKSEYLQELSIATESAEKKELILNRIKLEELLINKGLIECLKSLLEKTLSSARRNGCELKDLQGVVAVGGGSRIPLIKDWLKDKTKTIPFLTPPPIEAVAIGALSLTPGVKVRDVLRRGISLRCWEERIKSHIWHPIFLAGQPWPTSTPFEIVLAASKDSQKDIELILGEPELNIAKEVIYINGIPTIKSSSKEQRINRLEEEARKISLSPTGSAGEDCMKLKFTIDNECFLKVQGLDLRTGKSLETIVLCKIE